HLTDTEANEQLQIFFIYNTQIFSSARISRMIGHFKTLLQSIVENPEMPISKLLMITPEERQAIIATSTVPKKRRRYGQSGQTQELVRN
ncbi:MAG: condensation domain-containing protein, partial [Nitrososphaerales archaeon]